MPILLYETDDRDFRDTALDALKEARIPCYATGGDTPYGRYRTFCIYIENAADGPKANAILLERGAAPEAAFSIPTSWQFRTAATAVVLLLAAAIVWVLTTWPG